MLCAIDYEHMLLRHFREMDGTIKNKLEDFYQIDGFKVDAKPLRQCVVDGFNKFLLKLECTTNDGRYKFMVYVVVTKEYDEGYCNGRTVEPEWEGYMMFFKILENLNREVEL